MLAWREWVRFFRQPHRVVAALVEVRVGVEVEDVQWAVDLGQSGDAMDMYDRAQELYEERGPTLFDMTPFSDSDALAVTSAERWPHTPELPTLAEEGIKGFAAGDRYANMSSIDS